MTQNPLRSFHFDSRVSWRTTRGRPCCTRLSRWWCRNNRLGFFFSLTLLSISTGPLLILFLAAWPGVLSVCAWHKGDLARHLGVIDSLAILKVQPLPSTTWLLIVAPSLHRLNNAVSSQNPVQSLVSCINVVLLHHYRPSKETKVLSHVE